MSDTDVVRRLMERAAWHESEAERIRSAAETVAHELGIPLRGSKSRTRAPGGSATITSLIVTLLDENPREWSVAEIKDALVEKGVGATPENVRVAARRLTSRDEIVKLSRGTYVTRNRAPEPNLTAPEGAETWFGDSDATTTKEPHMAVVGG
jgi:hypothetical protein